MARGGHWASIVDTYVEEQPSVANELAEYRQLSSGSAKDALAAHMATSVPRPPELNDRRVLSDETPPQFQGGVRMPARPSGSGVLHGRV
jgi:hypothetical protein